MVYVNWKLTYHIVVWFIFGSCTNILKWRQEIDEKIHYAIDHDCVNCTNR